MSSDYEMSKRELTKIRKSYKHTQARKKQKKKNLAANYLYKQKICIKTSRLETSSYNFFLQFVFLLANIFYHKKTFTDNVELINTW